MKNTTSPTKKIFWYTFPLVLILCAGAIYALPWLSALIACGMMLAVYSLLMFLQIRMGTADILIQSRIRQIETIIHDMPIGVIAYDANFKIVLCNPASEEIFRIREDDVVGKIIDASQAGDPNLRILIQTIFSSLAPTVVKLSDPGVFPQISDLSFQDPELNVHVITDRIVDEKGGVVGFIKLITDITREHDLLKSKTEFIGIAAHQLRTPITAVNWALEALRSTPLTEEQKQFLDTAYAAVKNSLNTVNSLLDVSKIEEGRFGYEFQTMPFLPFLDDILKQAYDLGKQYNVSIYFDRPATDWRVRIDAQKLSMVFYNLLDNAIRYNVEKGTVTVGVQVDEPNKKIVVSIKDTGIGIPAEQISKLFSKFFRADNAIKTVGDGNGLGLYISRNIVRAHGGDITLESELNRGTTFFVSLPMAQEHADQNQL